jgi:hypothetical protein
MMASAVERNVCRMREFLPQPVSAVPHVARNQYGLRAFRKARFCLGTIPQRLKAEIDFRGTYGAAGSRTLSKYDLNRSFSAPF